MADVIYVRQKDFDADKGQPELLYIKDNLGVERAIIKNTPFVLMVDETQPEKVEEEQPAEEEPKPAE